MCPYLTPESSVWMWKTLPLWRTLLLYPSRGDANFVDMTSVRRASRAAFTLPRGTPRRARPDGVAELGAGPGRVSGPAPRRCLESPTIGRRHASRRARISATATESDPSGAAAIESASPPVSPMRTAGTPALFARREHAVDAALGAALTTTRDGASPKSVASASTGRRARRELDARADVAPAARRAALGQRGGEAAVGHVVRALRAACARASSSTSFWSFASAARSMSGALARELARASARATRCPPSARAPRLGASPEEEDDVARAA